MLSSASPLHCYSLRLIRRFFPTVLHDPTWKYERPRKTQTTRLLSKQVRSGQGSSQFSTSLSSATIFSTCHALTVLNLFHDSATVHGFPPIIPMLRRARVYSRTGESARPYNLCPQCTGGREGCGIPSLGGENLRSRMSQYKEIYIC